MGACYHTAYPSRSPAGTRIRASAVAALCRRASGELLHFFRRRRGQPTREDGGRLYGYS
jgi:hypothetical protein